MASLNFDAEALRNNFGKVENIHYLPCSINFNGKAAVNSHFNKYAESTNEKKEYTGTFRGYPLKGEELQVPESYQFVMMKEYQQQAEDKNFVATQIFDKFIYWNVSSISSENEPINNAIKWTNLANIIHEK